MVLFYAIVLVGLFKWSQFICWQAEMQTELEEEYLEERVRFEVSQYQAIGGNPQRPMLLDDDQEPRIEEVKDHEGGEREE